jgi:UDP-N-acetylmuramoyl-L-alanyl-D-glutamate--2,6-diaminopimelate ligase
MILRRRCLPHGSELDVRILGDEFTLFTRLIGEYNAANVLAAVCCLVAHGHAAQDVVEALREIETVPGRLELVAAAPVSVYVDYAHTPDALLRAQSSLRELIGGRLITVFGCGGDRDRAKRSPMGKIAGELSDYTVLTSDNPRSEAPEKIIEEILPGLRAAKGEERDTFRVIVDRREAIQHAISLARDGDAVLIAGKGHEDYQEIQGIRHPFSDREACYETLAGLGYV